MNFMKLRLLVLFGIGLIATSALAQNAKDPQIHFLHGPTTARLGSVAQIEVPGGHMFVDGDTLRRILKAEGEPVSDEWLGSLSPTNGGWEVWFAFEQIGYVKDTDKDKLNADKLLADYKKGTEAANRIREKSGIPPIHVVGWEVPPRYNEQTHNLEWAIRGTSEGKDVVNFDTRLLGRKGVMVVKLIVDPEEFRTTLPAFTNLLAGYSFESGQTYAEYRSGDKVAKYGLAALVTAGAAVGAAKLGLFGPLILLFKKAWKLIVIAFVAVIGVLKKFFGRLTGRGNGRPTT